MNFQKVEQQIYEINKQIRETEQELRISKVPVFIIPKDQISDFGDLWASEETVYSQVSERNHKVKKLKSLIEDRDSLKKFGVEKTCIDCGASISTKRVMANPKSVRCIHCQEDHETELEFLAMIQRTNFENYAFS